MAPLPVAHAQNIFPDMVTSGHVTNGTSGQVTSSSTTSQHHLKYDFVRTHILLKLVNLCPIPFVNLANKIMIN